jgi:hypothetical protein
MRTIYSEGSTSVLVNGAPTPSFKLERGVRQGCPLAPYLYILAHDALAHTLDGSSRDIQGLMLPNRKAISNLSFADEPSLYLLGTNDNLNRAKLALDAFCLASGSQVNWAKIHGLWASPRPRSINWGAQLGFHWVPPRGHATHLNIPVGFQLSQQIRDEAALARISLKLAFWEANASPNRADYS